MSETVQIGVLRDGHDGAANASRPDVGGNAMKLVVDQANENGGVHGNRIELVIRTPGRKEEGADRNVNETIAAWKELRDEGVLGIIGPCMTPNAIALLPHVESSGLPGIHWAGTDKATGEWQFQFQAGSLPDEGPALAYLLARKEHRRVACFRGAGDYGKAYLDPFLHAAKGLDIEVVAEFEIDRSGKNISEAVTAAHRSGADAAVAMGLFSAGIPLAHKIASLDWDAACYGNCGFAIVASLSSEARKVLAGWTVTDMYDPFNTTTQRFLDQYERRYGARPATSSVCFGRDLATLMVEGIRNAPNLSRAGLRKGLEAVRHIPAATGGAGSRLGFGPKDRLTPSGPRFFVFSQITSEGLEILSA